MKKAVMLVASLFIFAGVALADTATVNIYSVNADGVGKKLGTITATDTTQGLALKVYMIDVAEGEHGFHVHVNPSCEAVTATGKVREAAAAAGDYFDLKDKGAKSTDSSKGQLPTLTADKNNVIDQTVVIQQLAVKDLKNRSFVIHDGGKNYNANLHNGQSGRLACGVIK